MAPQFTGMNGRSPRGDNAWIMGLSLIWGVMDVINLTHGSMIALGMFGMYMLFTAISTNAYILLLPVIVGGLILGVIVYWMAVHWVVGRPPLMSLLSTTHLQQAMERQQ